MESCFYFSVIYDNYLHACLLTLRMTSRNHTLTYRPFHFDCNDIWNLIVRLFMCISVNLWNCTEVNVSFPQFAPPNKTFQTTEWVAFIVKLITISAAMVGISWNNTPMYVEVDGGRMKRFFLWPSLSSSLASFIYFSMFMFEWIHLNEYKKMLVLMAKSLNVELLRGNYHIDLVSCILYSAW